MTLLTDKVHQGILFDKKLRKLKFRKSKPLTGSGANLAAELERRRKRKEARKPRPAALPDTHVHPARDKITTNVETRVA